MGCPSAIRGKRDKAVNSISLSIPEGKTTALVGASGSGKTTLARLVPRFWDVDQGAVLIGGTDVKHLDPSELMSHISFVFQNTPSVLKPLCWIICASVIHRQLWRKSIGLWIRLDVEKSSIGLPHGLSTRIGVDGTYLSGGEQQRIVAGSRDSEKCANRDSR